MTQVAYISISSKLQDFLPEDTLQEVVSVTNLKVCLPEKTVLWNMSLRSDFYTTSNELLVNLLLNEVYSAYAADGDLIGELWVDYEELKKVYDFILEVLDETDPDILETMLPTKDLIFQGFSWCLQQGFERNMSDLEDFVVTLTPLMENYSDNIEIMLEIF